jgi:hypothetical protein
MAEARHPETRPETRDVWPRALLLFAGGLVLFLLVSSGALYLLSKPEAMWPRPGAAWSDNEATPALSTSPHQDLAAIRREEEAELDKLAWVDRAKGVARIPIEEAMKLVARNGLPQWSAENGADASGDCGLLTGDVPRSPQAQACRDAVKSGGAKP